MMRYKCRCKKCESEIHLPRNFPIRENITDNKLYFTLKCSECSAEKIYYQSDVIATKSAFTNKVGIVAIIIVFATFIVPYLVSVSYTVFFSSMLLLFASLVVWGSVEATQMNKFNSSGWCLQKELFLKNSTETEAICVLEDVNISEFQHSLKNCLQKCTIESMIRVDENIEPNDTQCGVTYLSKYKLNNLIGVIEITSTNKICFDIFDRDGQAYLFVLELGSGEEAYISSAKNLFVEVLNYGNYSILDSTSKLG